MSKMGKVVLHNPVHSQHEWQVMGGQTDGLQNDSDGDDPTRWNTCCSHAGSGGCHPARVNKQMSSHLSDTSSKDQWYTYHRDKFPVEKRS